ncbi:hypothetical protein pdam_00005594 [Pocillopora damicornis]|uniref:XK-related protein n=1 Tax=Pocillopora damicornis TaxID=46731 RepID=A0A3M6TKJ1_POCDA|nr:hypothetical protein pdam_00005594 [Pocillopora damicornis]
MLNRHQVALYVTHLLVLSSRLFAICYFTDSYKWWVIAVLMFHSCVVVIATVIQNRDKVDCDASNVSLAILFMGIHCLREYDLVELSISVEEIGHHETTMRLVLFTCVCVSLCVQCSWLYNEDLFTLSAKRENYRRFASGEQQ